MLHRFSHKTGTYGVSIVEQHGDEVLVQIEQVIKHQNKVIYIIPKLQKAYSFMSVKR